MFLNFFASIEKVIHTLIEAFILVICCIFRRLAVYNNPRDCCASIVGWNFYFHANFDISLNLITLFALVLAIGVVVDDAIVVIEAVHKMEEEHLSH
jgi:HAE1 family hydrophobic/amphiphilic exporter-1